MAKSMSIIRGELMKHIDEHPFLPDFFKTEMKQVAVSMFNPIGEMLGNMELLYRRTYMHKDELNELDGTAKESSK